ncbi:MAG: hypothetical protein ACREX3_07940, partial [Gammaproteobacteria bacterium]
DTVTPLSIPSSSFQPRHPASFVDSGSPALRTFARNDGINAASFLRNTLLTVFLTYQHGVTSEVTLFRDVGGFSSDPIPCGHDLDVPRQHLGSGFQMRFEPAVAGRNHYWPKLFEF